MAIRKKELANQEQNSFAGLNLGNSYMSLFLGVLVLVLISVAVLAFFKSRTFDRINTSQSTVNLETQVEVKQEKISKTYTVKSGDNLWIIAEKVYGSGYNWIDLAKANKLENPGLIFAGNKLTIPDVKPKLATISVQNSGLKSITGSSYAVQKGDHLWGISVRAYGDGFKWPELARVNKIPNPDLIYPDAVLKLPR